MAKLARLSLEKFLESLGSTSPAPGGGAAAALVTAQAAALGEMVARLNFRRSQKKKEPLSSIQKNILALSKIRKRLMVLLQKDAEVFTLLAKFKKEDRAKASYQTALKKAANVPYEMCEAAKEGAQLVSSEKPRTTPWLYSDLVESILLFEAGFETARLNVEINLRGIHDKPWVSRARGFLNHASKNIKQIRKKTEKS